MGDRGECRTCADTEARFFKVMFKYIPHTNMTHIARGGGSPELFFVGILISFYIWAHANFQNPTIIPCRRILTQAERRKKERKKEKKKKRR